jgi:hypothetical protein
MDDILIPPHLIASLAIFGGILSTHAFIKVPKMTRSSLVAMFQVGILILASASITFGVIYGWFSFHPEITSESRQYSVRWLLLYMFVAYDLWQFLILKFGRTL